MPSRPSPPTTTANGTPEHTHTPRAAPSAPGEAQATDWSDRRTDARRDHERIVAAALQAFAERGLEPAVLGTLLPDIFEMTAADRLLAEVLYEQPSSGSTDLLEPLGTLLDAAKVQGVLRPDATATATATELRILAGGCAEQLVRPSITDPAQWRRYGDLVLAALRGE